MIEKIIVAPRIVMKSLCEKKNTEGLTIISICTEKKDIIFTDAIKKRMNCDDIINLVFADVTESDCKISPSIMKKFDIFSKQIAKEIIKFIDNIKNKNIKLLIVQCDAGISRSPAVAIFAIRYLGMDEKVFRKEHPNIGPNSHVYETLAKISGLCDDYKKWWDNIDPNAKIIF